MAADANSAKNAFFQSFVPHAGAPEHRTIEHNRKQQRPAVPADRAHRQRDVVQPRRSTDIAEDGTGSGFTEAGAPPRFRCQPCLTSSPPCSAQRFMRGPNAALQARPTMKPRNMPSAAKDEQGVE